MEIATKLAQDLSLTENKSQYDAGCKRLLAQKEFLVRILKKCIPEYQELELEEISRCIDNVYVGNVAVDRDATNYTKKAIIEKKQEDSTLTEGTIFFDIIFDALEPYGKTKEYRKVIINLEAQNEFNPGYPISKRGIYYTSRMISSQKDIEFTHSEYGKIKKVYSIWICIDVPKKYKEHRNTITAYALQEINRVGSVKRPKEEYDLMEVIVIGIGDVLDDETCDELVRMLGVALSNEVLASEKKQILKEEYGIPMTEEIEREVDSMCNLSDGVFNKGLKKGYESGYEDGVEEGIAKGREDGIEQGIEQTQVEHLSALIDNGVLLEDGMKMFNMDLSKIEKYRKLVEERRLRK